MKNLMIFVNYIALTSDKFLALIPNASFSSGTLNLVSTKPAATHCASVLASARLPPWYRVSFGRSSDAMLRRRAIKVIAS